VTPDSYSGWLTLERKLRVMYGVAAAGERKIPNHVVTFQRNIKGKPIPVTGSGGP
jgi:hypothetical protein